MSKQKSEGTRGTAGRRGAEQQERRAPHRVQATRETVESIAVAVILAFLFRAFVAEAFVIPTGSMAPTLMGQHKDVQCPECGFWYRAGASIELAENSAQRSLEMQGGQSRNVVVGATCPLCRHQQLLDLEHNANQATFSGDRILVSKFIYDFTSPKRWDVIVFKYPFNAKQNFIKRLIGLPGETVLIKRGDIFIQKPGEESFHIARKPDHKLLTMLQLVDDSTYISKSLSQVGWPLRWQAWSPGDANVSSVWSSDDLGHSYDTKGVADQDVWLRYHHITPTAADWNQVKQLVESGESLPNASEYSGALITDFYAYNAFLSIDRHNLRTYDPDEGLEGLPFAMFGSPSLSPYGTLGLHWVGDLAFEGEIEIEGDQGELLLQLTKGGVAYACRIDIATGKATLSIGGGGTPFVADDGAQADAPSGETPITEPGTYDIRYSNVDAELRLWVNNRRVRFDGPTTYIPRDDASPVASLDDPGDLAPVGIGSHGAAMRVRGLRVLRDIYYIATTRGRPPHEYNPLYDPSQILRILDDPTLWEPSKLFESRGEFQYTLGPDQFFPMGDNSPQSSDARMWEEHFFSRDLLIGRALLIYWPHPWYRPIPYMPNVRRMRLIH